MAKKKTAPEDTALHAPAKRRAPARKKATAAPPIDIAIMAGTEPPANGRPEPSRAEIAEAAYFRHLNRGGRHGDEFSDWIEAERELKSRR